MEALKEQRKIAKATLTRKWSAIRQVVGERRSGYLDKLESLRSEYMALYERFTLINVDVEKLMENDQDTTDEEWGKHMVFVSIFASAWHFWCLDRVSDRLGGGAGVC